MQDHSPVQLVPSLSSKVSRRRIVRVAAGMAGSAAMLSSSPGVPHTLAQTATPVTEATGTFVRRNAHLADTGPVLEAYARAVAVMKGRADLDPTSWVFQARIHGAPAGIPVPPDVHWNQCPHGDKLFLPWHRMYLYWFERIVRKASGDPAFALPYWNYANPDQQVLPEPFRLPAEEANALFVPARNPDVNAGQAPPIPVGAPPNPPIFITLAEIAVRAFELLTEDPIDMSSALENLPHDLVHGWVGGRFFTGVPGWMDSTRTAALDPVFWLHHANIDRLWKRWIDLGGNRGFPENDPEWMDRVFNFYDEDGVVVEMSGKEIRDTVGQLDYRYDDDPADTPATVTPIVTPATPDDGAGEVPPGQAAASPAMDVSASGPFEVGAEGTSIAFQAPSDDPGATLDSAAPSRINVQGVTGTGVPAVMYFVFVNLPEGEPPDPAGPYFVGAIGLFARQPWDIEPGQHDHGAGGQSIDISRAIEELQAMGEWEGEVVVTLVPVDLAAASLPEDDEPAIAATPDALPAGDMPWILIEGISVTN